jgi:anti-sigma B factor antagonist
MRDEPLAIETAAGSNPETTILRLRGPLTMGTLFPLQDAFRAQTSPTVILDLSDVPYLDSAGLGSIMMLHVSAEKNGRHLLLAAVSERVMSLIRMTRVDTVLATFATVGEAEQSLRRPN